MVDLPDPGRGLSRVSDLAFIDLVIFDCDGVLVDSEPIASRTMAAAMRAAGAEITAEEAHVRFTGNAMTTIRRIFADDYGFTDIDAMIEGWSVELYREFETSLAKDCKKSVESRGAIHVFFAERDCRRVPGIGE